MNYITGGTVIKGGHNPQPSQITQRPPPPTPTKLGASIEDTNK